jgi:hypothetical protein
MAKQKIFHTQLKTSYKNNSTTVLIIFINPRIGAKELIVVRSSALRLNYLLCKKYPFAAPSDHICRRNPDTDIKLQYLILAPLTVRLFIGYT